MEFEARAKWWNGRGSRAVSHEGLDFCCFEDCGGKVVYLTANTLVPVLYDGEVVKIFQDLLGLSILVAHDLKSAEKILYSIYAHTVPLATLAAGRLLKSGEPLAAICSSEKKNINPHLHLSVLLAPAAAVDDLDWQTIHKIQGVSLCNPACFL